MEQPSSFVQHQPFQLFLLRQEFQLDELLQKRWRKRVQEQKGEERIVAKSQSTAMNLSSHVPASSSTAKIPIASESPRILIASRKPDCSMRRISKSDAASSSQMKLQDAYLGRVDGQSNGETCHNKKRNQALWIFPNLKPGVFMNRK